METSQPVKQKIKTSLVLIISTLLSLALLVYAFMQKKEADLQYVKAVEAEMRAEQALKEADQQRVVAIHQAHEAAKNLEQAMQELQDCKNKK